MRGSEVAMIFCIYGIVGRLMAVYAAPMNKQHDDPPAPWIENTALVSPALLGAAAGLLLGDLMHRDARRGLGLGLGILGVAALVPFVADGLAGLVTGPRSKFGVRRRIQSIRDAGAGVHHYDEVEEELREQGVM